MNNVIKYKIFNIILLQHDKSYFNQKRNNMLITYLNIQLTYVK